MPVGIAYAVAFHRVSARAPVILAVIAPLSAQFPDREESIRL
jgi:hypothetical protein